MLANLKLPSTRGDRQGRRMSGTDSTSLHATDLWKKEVDDRILPRPQTPGANLPSSPSESTSKAVNVARRPINEADELPQNLSETLSKEREPYIVSFHLLQEWDGFILSVSADSCRARVTDLTNAGPSDAEEVEIPLSELDDASKALLAPGRLFRWSIGYERTRAGQKTRISRIIIRRLPAWTKSALEKAAEEASRLAKKIKWE